MDDCEEAAEYGHGIEVIDAKDIPSWFQFDNSMNDEVDIFSMTALSTLVFLSQRDPNTTRSEDDKRLSLAYERLHLFPRTLIDQFGATVHTLDISHNEFDNLDFLKEFPSLSTLICDHNNITSNTVIPEMPHLKILWMNYCKITELYPWAKYLRDSCPKLKYISLMGNIAAPSYLNGGSFYEYLQYRLFMISVFPSVDHLDDRRVTPEQRREASRMYRRPLLERLSASVAGVRAVSDRLANMFLSTSPGGTTRALELPPSTTPSSSGSIAGFSVNVPGGNAPRKNIIV